MFSKTMAAMKAMGRMVGRVWASGTPGKVAVIVVALGIVLAGATGDSAEPEVEPVAAEEATVEEAAPERAPPPEPEPVEEEPERDVVAEGACRHYVNVVGDMTAGVLTDEEARVKLKEIYDQARYADDREVAAQAERLLAAWTHDDMEDLEPAAKALGTACLPHLSQG